MASAAAPGVSPPTEHAGDRGAGGDEDEGCRARGRAATTPTGMPIHSQRRRFFGAGSAGAHSYVGGGLSAASSDGWRSVVVARRRFFVSPRCQIGHAITPRPPNVRSMLKDPIFRWGNVWITASHVIVRPRSPAGHATFVTVL